jgi:hypothetical protein
MIGHKRFIFFFLFFFLSNTLAFATPRYGFNFSYPAISKEPPDLSGTQLMLTYDPQNLQWRNVNVYFDGGFSFFKTSYVHHSTITIYSIAPVLRLYLKRYRVFCPYIEFSIGLAYLNHTRMEKRNLGIHFAFQDRLGIGTFIGPYEHLTVGLHAFHYSNASFSSHNSGITVPIALDIGYRF